jgi:hypothetical protein
MLKRDGKALIDLVDGLSSGSVVLVNVTNDNLADHDARLEDLFEHIRIINHCTQIVKFCLTNFFGL